MYYVYSTLSADVCYTGWNKGSSDLPVEEHQVLIKGGTNVMDADRVHTPLGVVTEVKDEDVEFLNQNFIFNLHKENGFIRVEKKKADPEKVAGDMESKDESAPLTPEDFTGDVKVSTGKASK